MQGRVVRVFLILHIINQSVIAALSFKPDLGETCFLFLAFPLFSPFHPLMMFTLYPL